MMLMNRFFQKAMRNVVAADSPEGRAEPRFEHCLRVTAPVLPDHRALTVDVSTSGACLETFAPVPVGMTFDLDLEIGVFPLHLKARVLWCEKMARGIYRVGLCLAGSSPHSLHAYQRYVRKEME